MLLKQNSRFWANIPKRKDILELLQFHSHGRILNAQKNYGLKFIDKSDFQIEGNKEKVTYVALYTSFSIIFRCKKKYLNSKIVNINQRFVLVKKRNIHWYIHTHTKISLVSKITVKIWFNQINPTPLSRKPNNLLVTRHNQTAYALLAPAFNRHLQYSQHSNKKGKKKETLVKNHTSQRKKRKKRHTNETKREAKCIPNRAAILRCPPLPGPCGRSALVSAYGDAEGVRSLAEGCLYGRWKKQPRSARTSLRCFRREQVLVNGASVRGAPEVIPFLRAARPTRAAQSRTHLQVPRA